MVKILNPKLNDPKKKKKNKGGRNGKSKKSEGVVPKDNPFETIWSRRKFDIMGKKRKGEERRVGLARSLSIDKRKKTLLKEYEESGKSSAFIDKRIGEQNDELEEFDKAILRSQRERLKLNKKSKYNLSDGEENEFEFEFDGVDPFTERDDFEDEVPPEGDDDAEASEITKNAAYSRQMNARNSMNLDDTLTQEEENKHRSKKEVMAEVMAKGKAFKAEKAKLKEEDEKLTEELDKHFGSLQNTKIYSSASLMKTTVPLEQPDSYDKLVFEMQLDKRAQPSERTKTPEEIALEKKERLERLEEERQKRMVAADESSDEEDSAHEEADEASTRGPLSISGDDLGDSFILDEEPRTKKGWVDKILEQNVANDSESEDGEYSDDDQDDDNLGTDLEDEEEEEEEDDDGDDNDDDDDDEDMEPSVGVGIKKRDKGSLDSAKAKELPIMIGAPDSFDELCALVEGRPNGEIVEAIDRIRLSNPIIVAENRKKMQVFYGLLLQYFAVIANKKPLNFELLNLMCKPLMEMSKEIPYFAAICARQRILRTRMQFCDDIKNPEKSCWPSLKTLFLLRLWSVIFPCSDFRHVVMTPALLLMSEYLMRCPILSGRDVAVGSFLCSMVLTVTKQSRKFCPEAIMFLRTLLMAARDRQKVPSQDSEFCHLVELKTLEPLLHIHDSTAETTPLDFLVVMDTPEDDSFFASDNFRGSVLIVVIETLRGFVQLYEGLNSFPEIFTPIATLLLEVADQKNMPDVLKEKFNDVGELIKKKAHEYHLLRRPLQMRKQKPVPIRLFTPKFEERFVKGRDYDPDRTRVEIRKMKKLLKQEAKGAVRELRKDNHFLFDVKEKEKALQQEERAEKHGRTRAFLQEQEHAFKSGQLGKGRKRKR